MHVEALTLHGFTHSGPLRSAIGLLPGNVNHEVPVGEIPAQVSTFLNQFMKAEGNYPTANFWIPGWVCSSKQAWWSGLTLYVLDVFESDLQQLGLYEAVRVTYFGIYISIPTFYAIIEMHCLASGTFFSQSVN